MNASLFASDIPHSLARVAYSGISFTPEKRADQTISGYAETLASDYAELLKFTEGKPGMVEVLDREFARYRAGYRERYLKKLSSDSRCVSSMIAGPANFPVRRMEKRNNVAHKRLVELIEFRERAFNAIKKTLCPELRPIMSGDSNATQRLAADILEAETRQAHMKLVNGTIRKNLKLDNAGKLAALVAIGLSEAQAALALTKDCFGGIGFAPFELTNNGANIRRMKQRLESITRNQRAATVEAQGENARLEDCPPENRVRLFFPGKPSAEIRSRLKSRGFRWSPTIGAWQAYRNPGSIETAKQVAGLAAA